MARHPYRRQRRQALHRFALRLPPPHFRMRADMSTETGEPLRLAIHERLPDLQAIYRNDFGVEFDANTFRGDDFYAFQVLEKSIRDGSPVLQALAGEMEATLMRVVEQESVMEVVAAAPAPDTIEFAIRRQADAAIVNALSAEPPQERQDPDAPTVRLDRHPSAAPEALEPAVATPAAMELAAAPVPEAVPTAAARAPAAGDSERRTNSGRGAGHVRLGNREIVCLSQLRVQYRRTFGVFIDTFEFTGNDLYARTLLALCAKSNDPTLVNLAREFLNDDSTPRFHRRKGRPDVDLATLH
jgi:hypothetical protein